MFNIQKQWLANENEAARGAHSALGDLLHGRGVAVDKSSLGFDKAKSYTYEFHGCRGGNISKAIEQALHFRSNYLF